MGLIAALSSIIAAERAAPRGPRKPRPPGPARGFHDGRDAADIRRLVVRVDERTFLRVTSRAESAGHSVSEEIRHLLAALERSRAEP
jgi:hypothetical protein